MMRMFLLVFLFISFVSGGPNDTVDQLKAAVSNVPYADQVSGGEVTTVKGSVPAWLSGRASSQYLCPTGIIALRITCQTRLRGIRGDGDPLGTHAEKVDMMTVQPFVNY